MTRRSVATVISSAESRSSETDVVIVRHRRDASGGGCAGGACVMVETGGDDGGEMAALPTLQTHITYTVQLTGKCNVGKAAIYLTTVTACSTITQAPPAQPPPEASLLEDDDDISFGRDSAEEITVATERVS